MKTKIVMVLLAGTALLAACKGSGSGSEADSAKRDSAQLDSAENTKLVKTGEIRFKVKDVRQATAQISKITTLCGGMVMHHDMHSNIISQQNINMPNDSVKKLTVYNSTADMTIKVPVEYVEILMDSITKMGDYVDNRKMEVEDRSLDYLSEKLKAQNRIASVKQRRNIKLTQRSADSILLLKDDVVDRKISNMRTDEAAKFSVLNLSLYQNNTVAKEVVLSDDPSDYKGPLSTRAGIAFSNGWYYFSAIIVGLLNLWVFILIGAGVWIGIIIYKKKKHNKTEPTT
jgi:hypothetical protein